MNRFLPATLMLFCLGCGDGVDREVRVAFKELSRARPEGFRVDPYMHTAALLQAQGKDKACDTLLQLAKNHKQDEEVMILCRMLFTRKANGEFRRPMIGAASFLGGSDYADWPLEPIELVDGVPFLIARGYSSGGRPELAEMYVNYCIENCGWNDLKFNPKSMAEKQAALGKLLASPKWKTNLNDHDTLFLSSQIE